MKNRYYIFITLLTLMCLSCQKEELYTGPCDVHFKAYVQDEVTVSRAEYSSMPENYADFTAELFVAVSNSKPSDPIISTTMTQEDGALTANLRLEGGDYYIYGYLPQTDGANLTFNTNTATMTIPNIAGLGNTDALVIRKGDKLTIATSDTTKDVTLLMDHLMAKVTPRFYIDSVYAKIRSIRIKKVEFSIDGAMTYMANVAFDNTQSPISWNVTTWTPGATSNMEVVAYENAEPTVILPTTKDAALACGECYVCPAQPIAGLNMTVTYDVYGTDEDQPVRPDAEATNKMKIKVSGNTLTKLEAGKNYQLNIRIVPTYLYVLSDNDEESLVING